jgi:hypothetical protein
LNFLFLGGVFFFYLFNFQLAIILNKDRLIIKLKNGILPGIFHRASKASPA